MSIQSVMPSNYLILCRPLLCLPSMFPSIRVCSSESVLHIWWPKYWSFSFSISPSNEYSGLVSFRIDWLDLLAVQGTLSPKNSLQSKELTCTYTSLSRPCCFILRRLPRHVAFAGNACFLPLCPMNSFLSSKTQLRWPLLSDTLRGCPFSLGWTPPPLGFLHTLSAVFEWSYIFFFSEGLRMTFFSMEYYSAIKTNAFESVIMRWMKLEPIIESELSQYTILTITHGI